MEDGAEVAAAEPPGVKGQVADGDGLVAVVLRLVDTWDSP